MKFLLPNVETIHPYWLFETPMMPAELTPQDELASATLTCLVSLPIVTSRQEKLNLSCTQDALHTFYTQYAWCVV